MPRTRFGVTLVRLLDENGLSQADFSRRTGHPSSYVTQLIHGRHRPPLDCIDHWSAVCEFTADQAAALLDSAYLAHTPEPIVRELLRLREQSRQR